MTFAAWGEPSSWCWASCSPTQQHGRAGCSSSTWWPSEVSLCKVGPSDLATAKEEAKETDVKVTPGCANADTTGKIELRLWIWKRKRVKQIYLFVEESDPQESGHSQGTTAPAALRNFPVYSGHGSRSGPCLIILVSGSYISHRAHAELILEEKLWRYKS